MSDERLKLVTDFADLRAGMIVWVKPCGQCDGEHRGMLLSPTTYPEKGLVYPKVPISPCRPPWVTGCGINAETVALKMVWREEDDLADVDSAALWEEIAGTRPDRRARVTAADAAEWGRGFERIGTKEKRR